jgi:hypothetical protein
MLFLDTLADTRFARPSLTFSMNHCGCGRKRAMLTAQDRTRDQANLELIEALAAERPELSGTYGLTQTALPRLTPLWSAHGRESPPTRCRTARRWMSRSGVSLSSPSVCGEPLNARQEGLEQVFHACRNQHHHLADAFVGRTPRLLDWGP